MRLLLKIIGGIMILGALAAGAGYFHITSKINTPMNAAAPTIEFTVPKGASSSKVAKLLAQKKIISDSLYWRLYLKTNPLAPSPKAGRHKISASMNIPKLIEVLGENPLSDDKPLTMVEGWRLRDADAHLTQAGLITEGSYLKAANNPKNFKVPFEIEGDSLAGYLLPETYMIPPGKLDVSALIQRQIDAFHKRFVIPHKEEIQKNKRTLRQLVIVAAMLEREEPNPQMRPSVADVMYKRLDKGTPLGIDATSRFTLENWNDRRAFLKKLRDPKDPYNTRLKSGLPPGPIGAPSIESLTAALRPKKNPYWYYLHDSNQRIHFARTAKEHEANRKRYNVW